MKKDYALRTVLYFLLRKMHSGHMPEGKEKDMLQAAIDKLEIDNPRLY